MAEYRDVEPFMNATIKFILDAQTRALNDYTKGYVAALCSVIEIIEKLDVQKEKHGRWKFKEKTKLVPIGKLAIKEGYSQVNDRNLEKAVMNLKKRITVRKPICSVCGYSGDDECDATSYCPNCGARMDGEENGKN